MTRRSTASRKVDLGVKASQKRSSKLFGRKIGPPFKILRSARDSTHIFLLLSQMNRNAALQSVHLG